jgi:hypothetical protein
VAFYRDNELKKCHPLFSRINFTNKTMKAELSSILKLNRKTTNTTPNDPMDVMWSMLKIIKPTPLLFLGI